MTGQGENDTSRMSLGAAVPRSRRRQVMARLSLGALEAESPDAATIIKRALDLGGLVDVVMDDKPVGVIMTVEEHFLLKIGFSAATARARLIEVGEGNTAGLNVDFGQTVASELGGEQQAN